MLTLINKTHNKWIRTSPQNTYIDCLSYFRLSKMPLVKFNDRTLSLSVSLSVHLPDYLTLCLFIYLTICLSVFLSFYLSFFLSYFFNPNSMIVLCLCLSFCLFIYLPFCLTVCSSIWLSVCLSFFLSIFLSFFNTRIQLSYFVSISLINGNYGRFLVFLSFLLSVSLSPAFF